MLYAEGVDVGPPYNRQRAWTMVLPLDTGKRAMSVLEWRAAFEFELASIARGDKRREKGSKVHKGVRGCEKPWIK